MQPSGNRRPPNKTNSTNPRTSKLNLIPSSACIPEPRRTSKARKCRSSLVLNRRRRANTTPWRTAHPTTYAHRRLREATEPPQRPERDEAPSIRNWRIEPNEADQKLEKQFCAQSPKSWFPPSETSPHHSAVLPERADAPPNCISSRANDSPGEQTAKRQEGRCEEETMENTKEWGGDLRRRHARSRAGHHRKRNIVLLRRLREREDKQEI